MGAYGNTWRATQQPPLDQMAVTLDAATAIISGRPGDIITHTLTLKNTGGVADTYAVSVQNSDGRFHTSLYQEGYNGARQFALDPQEEITVTVRDEIQVNSSQEMSHTFSVQVIGGYGVRDEILLTTLVSTFQETGGQVVMEAEHFNRTVDRSNRTWQPQTSLPNYQGSGYLSLLPDTDLQFTTNYTTVSPEIQFTVNFTTTGVYTIWLRGHVPNSAGDSVYIALDNQPVTSLSGFSPQTWSWASRNIQGSLVTIEVSQPGLHTLRL